MAKVKEIRDIPLSKLELGKAQVRRLDLGKGIDELVESIRQLGQLQPIMVCPGKKPGYYEIILGQRRFYACQELGLETISAAMLDEKVDEITAKVISLTENVVRRDLNSADVKDACIFLYKRYGSVNDVCARTGLPYSLVTNSVKYDRLIPELKELVDNKGLDVKAAVRAQDALMQTGDVKSEEAITLAMEMSGMSDVQQRNVGKKIKEAPVSSIEDVVEAAKTGVRISQIVVTLGTEELQALKAYANQEDMSQDEAAAFLIRDQLAKIGLLDEQQ